MSEQWILRLSLQHSQGIAEYRREIAQPVEFTIASARAVDELKAGLGLVSMAEGISTMKRRQMRREIIKVVARQLAEQLADTIEDAAGWHGEDRARGVVEAGLARPIT